jgi:hypothetical protein
MTITPLLRDDPRAFFTAARARSPADFLRGLVLAAPEREAA